MRHSHKGRKLKRTATHRASTLSSLASSLITHKKIRTTVAKAKETRMYVEPIITRAKNAHNLTGDDAAVVAKRVNARREVARVIKDKEILKTLFTEIAPKVSSRPGGYTRVVKLGRRLGDSAEMALLELVDWNDNATPRQRVSKPRPTRRTAKATPKVQPVGGVLEAPTTQVEEAGEAANNTAAE
ncbi:MAG TPA: 50S ribosomal protein L17 [Candidatus Kapabacteria bacterium]|nr:50S ribosomal protein L17 [Candidatus Kapabacteria bacterium]